MAPTVHHAYDQTMGNSFRNDYRMLSGGSRGGHRGHVPPPPLLFLNLLSHSYNLDSKL